MGKGISIGVASDTREFASGVKKGVIEPLEDAADSLDDVQKAGDKAGDKLERAFKDAQGEVSEFKKDQARLATEMQKQSKKGADALASNTESGTSRAKADLEELGNEARQNAAETFSSFDGTAQGFADGIQGTMGGIVSSLGPVGAALGAAAALGLGFLMAGLEDANEETERLKGLAAELGQEYIETGRVGEVSMEYLIGVVQELAAATGDGTDSLKGLKRISDRADDSLADLAQSAGMTEEQLRDLWRESNTLYESLRAQSREQDLSTEAGQEAAQTLQEQADGHRAYRDEIGKSIGVVVAAGEAQKAAAEAGLPELQAKAGLIATVNDAYDDAAGAADNFILEESGLFDTAAYLASMAEREQALKDYQQTLALSGLSSEAKSFIDSQGYEAAAAFLSGYEKATPAQKRELDRIWTTAAKDNSGVYMSSINNTFSKPIKGPQIERPVVPEPDTSRLDAAIKRHRAMNVEVRYVDRQGRRID